MHENNTEAANKVTLDQISHTIADEWLTSAEVAEMLKCSQQTVRKLTKVGKLPHVNVNVKKKLYSKKGILKFLKQQHIMSTNTLATMDYPALPKKGDHFGSDGKLIRDVTRD